jgi:hypothetical protein
MKSYLFELIARWSSCDLVILQRTSALPRMTFTFSQTDSSMTSDLLSIIVARLMIELRGVRRSWESAFVSIPWNYF